MKRLRHLAAWFRRRRLEADLREELAQHVEWRTQALIAEGIPEDEARRRAAVSVGNISKLRQDTRDVWGYPSIESVLQDARYGLRQLRRSPVFAAVAIGSLALAIGAGSAVFAVGRAALYRPIDVIHPEQLLILRWQAASEQLNLFNSFDGSSSVGAGLASGTSFSYSALEHMAAEAAALADLAGFADLYRANLTINGQSQIVRGQLVSGSYFPLLGIRPERGRLLARDDDSPTAGGTVVISHRIWRERFGAGSEAIGAPVSVNGVPLTIVGVTGESFSGTIDVGEHADVYVPFGIRDRIVHDGETGTDPNYWWVQILARRHEGSPLDALNVRLDTALGRDLRAARPSLTDGSLPHVQLHAGAYGSPYTREGLQEPLRIMVFAVGALLLIACANIAGLQVARATAREREMAVRLAIGAGRTRVARQLVVESVVLALLGGGAGLLLAQMLGRLLVPALHLEAEAALEIRVDWIVAAFTTLIAVVSGVVFGVAPAWRASSPNASIVASGSLTSRGPTEAPRVRLGRVLLVAQIALSLSLVFTAALFVQSLRRLQHVDIGFDSRNLLLFDVNPILNGYEETRVFGYWRQALERIRGTAAVLNATITTHPLIANSSSSSNFSYTGSDGSEKTEESVARLSVGDDFFETMRIPLRLGRRIDARDTSRGVRAAVINETLARRAFPDSSPLGQRFRFSTRKDAPFYEVVGVAADAQYMSLRRGVPAVVYISRAENPSPGSITFYVRTDGKTGRVAHAVDEVMRQIDASVPAYGMRTQDQQIALYLTQDVLFARLGTALGGLALLLACIGVYGLLSYSVARRTPELGVRLALGAAPGHLRWFVLRESLLVAGVGVAIGVPTAIAVAQLTRSSLFGVQPTSPALLATAVLILVTVALAAGYVPARRAARLDPLVALRAE
jgi:predicted permease